MALVARDPAGVLQHLNVGVAPMAGGATLGSVPTTRPRYTVTDTGEIQEMLDLAERRWPECADRRRLLLKLAAAGAETVAAEFSAENTRERAERQRQALRRAAELVDSEALLSDAAWR